MSPDTREPGAWRLYADLGNSSLHWAAWAGETWAAQGRLGTEALAEQDAAEQIVAATQSAGLDRAACGGSALVASRPGSVRVAEMILMKVCGEPPRLLGRDLRSELVINYEDPGQIGQDRLAAVEGALSRLRPPLVVLSVGTCVTAEAVSAAGALVAGAIAPGLEAHAAGLRSMTPHLRPALEQAVSDLRSGREPAGSGRSTAESLWLGLIAALAGTADRLVALMREQAGARAPVVATGGDAYLVARHSELVERVEPTLVLDGLRAIDERTP